ncbi:NEDD8-conjugating enzyme Ubc12-like [Cucumis melo var. makuwa]|uniref:NEDD8-conjugating enzyme Ubc12-like n=2 Tax=Cucumis melo TaxID=3656 RepID=A0A5D3CPZ9_CUCMM|nr:NEDD8-conjugating enzyme Ubc12-like [Cucumis melo var. makuwa]TYK13462.1 NEDD8-conjugating enzyme Ubc12-like [Cucumis melo var. makuwa]
MERVTVYNEDMSPAAGDSFHISLSRKRDRDAVSRPSCHSQYPRGTLQLVVRNDGEHSVGTMIKLFKVKEKQREIAANANGVPPVKKQTAGELRLQKDISELNLPKTCSISFPNGKDDLMNFEVTIHPDEGYYLGGTFLFSFQVSPVYPHEPPKVKCKTKVYHPNIDLEGNVCLNILREDWKPVLNINTIIYGLFHLFTQPNHEDPLNHDAAAVLRDNPKMFEFNVRRAMAGGYVGQTYFTRCM